MFLIKKSVWLRKGETLEFNFSPPLRTALFGLAPVLSSTGRDGCRAVGVHPTDSDSEPNGEGISRKTTEIAGGLFRLLDEWVGPVPPELFPLPHLINPR